MEIEKKLLTVREEERRKIAREIHDGPAQSLAAILLRLDYLIAETLPDAPELIGRELLQIRTNLKDCLQEMRQVLFDLKPLEDNSSLLAVLQDYFAAVKARHDFSIDFKVKGIARIYPQYMQTALFRLIQEAVNNSRKYAGAGQVQVLLTESEEKLEVLIADQGSGFDADRTFINENRFGIAGMKERVELLQGKMTIQSQPGAGTRILIEIPLKGRN